MNTERIETLTSQDAYRHWSVGYPPAPHNALMRIEQAAMCSILPDLHNKVVLDLAGGSGRYARVALSAGARAVFVVDNSLSMLHTGSLSLSGVVFVGGETASIPLPAGSVDVLICAMALGHLPMLYPSFVEISRVLVTGGYALLSDFHTRIVAVGAQRTFKDAAGAIHAVEHYSHSHRQYQEIGQQVGLKQTHLLEPSLWGQPSDTPIVAVYRFEKSP